MKSLPVLSPTCRAPAPVSRRHFDPDRRYAWLGQRWFTTIRHFADTGLADYARDLVRDLTGRKMLHDFAGAQDSRNANTARNILAALIAQMAISQGSNPAKDLGKLPTMMPENGEKGRAAHDDEILLCRIIALHRMGRKRSAKIPGIQYVLVEAAAMPSETTVVTWDDFNFAEQQGLTVTLPGVGTADTWVTSRTVPIPARAAATLENACQVLLNGKDEILAREPIAYRGKHAPGGHKASASASGNIGRMIAAAGLARRGLTGTSPNRWRVLRELRTSGFQDAQVLAGKPTPDALLAHLQYPEMDTTRPKERTRGNIAKRAESKKETSM